MQTEACPYHGVPPAIDRHRLGPGIRVEGAAVGSPRRPPRARKLSAPSPRALQGVCPGGVTGGAPGHPLAEAVLGPPASTPGRVGSPVLVTHLGAGSAGAFAQCLPDPRGGWGWAGGRRAVASSHFWPRSAHGPLCRAFPAGPALGPAHPASVCGIGVASQNQPHDLLPGSQVLFWPL